MGDVWNRRACRETAGLVIENYLRRLDGRVNRTVKSIVDPRRVIRPVNPHYFEYVYLSATDETHRPVDGAYAETPRSELLRINHYHYKSEEEFLLKSTSTRADGYPRPPVSPDYLEHLRNEEAKTGQVDHTILRYVSALSAALKTSARPGNSHITRYFGVIR